MKKRHFTKTIALFLATVMLIFALPLTSLAVPPLDEGVTAKDGIPEDDPTDSYASVGQNAAADPFVLGAGEKSLAELQTMTVNVATLPEFIDVSTALAKGHVNRLTAQEKNTNTVIYQNKDGTKSTYIFGSPVKYIDSEGVIRDKSSALVPVLNTRYAYAMLDNSTKAYFSKTSSTGVTVHSDRSNASISMIPVSNTVSNAFYDEESRSVLYSGVFGSATILSYTTTLNGVKEDIILVKNIGENEFEFELTANGLTPVEIANVWYLVDSSNEKIASLGRVIIKDSNGIDTEGTMNVTAAQNGKYTVTITAPESFLNDTDTEYPVYIDPTVTIYEEGYYTGTDEYGDSVYVDYTAISDIGLYETFEGASNMENQVDTLLLGSAGNGEGRVIYRLYDFYGEYGQYKNLIDSQIGSVELHVNIRDLYDNTSVTAMPMSNDEVSDSTVAVCDSTLWNAHVNVHTSTAEVEYGALEMVVDITEIARGWARYNNGMSTNAYDMARNGFVLMGDPDAHFSLCSTEACYDNVYVVMDTSNMGGIYYINNVDYGSYLNADENCIATILSNLTGHETDAQWHIKYMGFGRYLIMPVRYPEYYLRPWLDQAKAYEVTEIQTHEYFWEITYSSIGGYMIKSILSGMILGFDTYEDNEGAKLFSEDSLSYQTLWRFASAGDFVNLSSFTVDPAVWVDVGDTYTVEYTVSPSNATWAHRRCFDWSSSDTSVVTITDDGTITAHNDGSAKITMKHIYTQQEKTIVISVGQIIPDGTYYMINTKTELFIGALDTPRANGSEIYQTNTDDIGSQKWNVSYDSNGYYYISFAETGKFLSVSDYMWGPGYYLSQEIIEENANRWRILETGDGKYILTADDGLDFYLSPHSSSSSGAESLYYPTESLGDISNFQWYFAEAGTINNINLEGQQFENWCWAACAKMFAEYYSETPLTISQNEIVDQFTDENDTILAVSKYELLDAIKWCLNLSLTDPSVCMKEGDNKYDKNEIKNILDLNHILVVGRLPKSEGIGHAFLIVGYIYIDNQIFFITADPFPYTTGSYCVISYEWLCDGKEASFVDSEDICVWNFVISFNFND